MSGYVNIYLHTSPHLILSIRTSASKSAKSCGRLGLWISEFTWNIHLHMILKSSSSSKPETLHGLQFFPLFFCICRFYSFKLQSVVFLFWHQILPKTIHSKNDSPVLYAWFFGHLLWDCNGLCFLLQASTDGSGGSIDSDHRRTKPSKKMGGKKFEMMTVSV